MWWVIYFIGMVAITLEMDKDCYNSYTFDSRLTIMLGWPVILLLFITLWPICILLDNIFLLRGVK